MIDLRQAAQQALDALKAHQPVAYRMNGRNEKFPIYECDPLKQSRTASAITTLEAALAAPQPEPLIHKHEWFRTGAMAHGVCRCIHCGVWNHEVDAQHGEIEQLKAERDAAVRELELTTVERNRAHRACEQISVRLHAAMAERDAATLAERKAILDILWDYAGRKDLTDEDQSLLKHLNLLICARSKR
jgi:hypothetical protein